MLPLRFEGASTIQSAVEAQARLSEALAGGGDVSVDCSAVDEADIAFLQLLIAAHRSATMRGISLRLTPRPSKEFLAALDRSGLTLPEGLIR